MELQKAIDKKHMESLHHSQAFFTRRVDAPKSELTLAAQEPFVEHPAIQVKNHR
jgi:hypothetical protein